jgi:hypothetical protein
MKGETIHLQIAAEDAHVFSTETGRRVSGERVGPPVPAS